MLYACVRPSTIQVFNCTTGQINQLTWGQVGTFVCVHALLAGVIHFINILLCIVLYNYSIKLFSYILSLLLLLLLLLQIIVFHYFLC